jgi:hypothetical protein
MAGNGSFDQRTDMRRLTLRLSAVDRQIEEAMMGDGDGHMRASIYGGGDGGSGGAVTPGEVYVRSEAYTSWMRDFPSGAPSGGGEVRGRQADYPLMARALGLREATAKMRTLITAADQSAGQLVQPLQRGLVEGGLIRPLTIRALVTVLPVSTDTVELRAGFGVLRPKAFSIVSLS